jgi:hypothetical protein
LLNGVARNTVIAASGHMVAHNEQPVHLSSSIKWAAWYPRGVKALVKPMMRVGHAPMHKPHPLQRFSSTTINPCAVCGRGVAVGATGGKLVMGLGMAVVTVFIATP